jgi:hypothetical protein
MKKMNLSNLKCQIPKEEPKKKITKVKYYCKICCEEYDGKAGYLHHKVEI